MTIGGSLSIRGTNDYRVSSIHGNPTSLRPIQRLTQNEQQGNQALVIAQKTSGSNYIKDYGELEKTTNTVIGGFEELLALQNGADEETKADSTASSYASYLMDTIGVMGFKNQIREQLGTHLL